MEPEIQNAAEQWLLTTRATRDSETLSKVVARAREIHQAQGGYISSSHFERAYLELVNEKAIQPFKGNMAQQLAEESAPIPQDVVNFIERASSFELRSKYRTDPQFRRYYDLYQKQPKQSQTQELTADEYRRMPSKELQQKLRSPSFKLQVMKLIAAGQILWLLLLPLVRHVG